MPYFRSFHLAARCPCLVQLTDGDWPKSTFVGTHFTHDVGLLELLPSRMYPQMEGSGEGEAGLPGGEAKDGTQGPGQNSDTPSGYRRPPGPAPRHSSLPALFSGISCLAAKFPAGPLHLGACHWQNRSTVSSYSVVGRAIALRLSHTLPSLALLAHKQASRISTCTMFGAEKRLERRI